MKNKTKLKHLTVATLAGLQFALPAFAADTNEPSADNSTNSNNADASQAAEIDALKQEVQELAQKINTLESQQQQPPAQSPATCRIWTRKSAFWSATGKTIGRTRRRWPKRSRKFH